MKSCEKMLTYEEWDEYYRTEPSGREIFKLARQGMTPIPEAVGFEKWANTPSREYTNASSKERLRIEWQTAQAAILSDPMVIDLRGVEWPEWADGIRVMFCNKRAMGFQDKCGENESGRYENFHKIHRPTPAWQPKEGEAVFVLRLGGSIDIAMVSDVGKEISSVKFLDGSVANFKHINLKPFDPANIGLPWEEI